MAEADLAEFIEEVTGDAHLRVEEDLGGGYVRLRTSEAERRQAQQDIRGSEDIVLELLRNARDAGACLIYVATIREGAKRHITVIDDGSGIPGALWEAVFEPRVTSKLDTFHSDQWGVHGRGMALFSIACNSEEHRVAASGEGLGTSFYVRSDTGTLGEKADQSSLPHFAEDADGRQVVRGPRNINRVVAEFTLNQKGACLVYLGSPVEVLASLVENGRRALPVSERTFARDAGEYPLCLRPALAGTPDELAHIAGELGLSLSERSARRVLDGQVEPAPPFISVLDAIASARDADGKRALGRDARNRRSTHSGDARRLKVAAEDLDAFSSALREAWRVLADAYYLDADVAPEIRVTRNGVQVSFPAVEALRD